MRITSLLENTSRREDICSEHGLSLYIEANGKRILFDMGQTELFARNARTLGVALEDVELAVLSHGHYDHGGGLSQFLSINTHAPVYVRKDAFLPYYNAKDKYIGLDVSLRDSGRLVLTNDQTRIDENMTLFSCNGMDRPNSLGAFGLTVGDGDGRRPDGFTHEQYLLIEENGKRVLISGCSHKGVIDIARYFAPDVLVGGFHFSKLALGETLSHAARTLGEMDTEFYTCHCTGEEQYAFMKKYMPRLHYLRGGETVII